MDISDSDNGLSPGRYQTFISTNAGILLTWPLGTNFSGMLKFIHFHSRKCIYKCRLRNGMHFVSATINMLKKCYSNKINYNSSASIWCTLHNIIPDKFMSICTKQIEYYLYKDWTDVWLNRTKSMLIKVKNPHVCHIKNIFSLIYINFPRIHEAICNLAIDEMQYIHMKKFCGDFDQTHSLIFILTPMPDN